LKLKTKVGSTTVKDPSPRTNPNIDATPNPTLKAELLVRVSPTIDSRREEDTDEEVVIVTVLFRDETH
jgi:hypothetical protein